MKICDPVSLIAVLPFRPLGGPNSFGWELFRRSEAVVIAEGASSGLKSALRFPLEIDFSLALDEHSAD